MILPQPRHDIDKDFDTIATAIENLERISTHKPPSKASLIKIQNNLETYAALYDESVLARPYYYMLYELMALTLKLNDQDDDADSCLWRATEFMDDGDVFISNSANNWLAYQKQIIADADTVAKRNKFLRRRRIIVWSVLIFFIIVSIVSGPISDKLLLSSADPSMITLSQQASMTRSAELAFLRTKPQLVDSAELTTDCKDSSSTTGAEGGCWIRSAGVEHIYVRKLSDARLQPLEIVVTAHETLHAIYANMDSSSQNHLNEQLQQYYDSSAGASLKKRMSVYADLDSSGIYNELHSIIGTESSNLPQELESYYSQYFLDRSIVTQASTAVKQTFDAMTAQLNSDNAAITKGQNDATNLYNQSVYAARAGNIYLDNYYYGLYTTAFNKTSTLINEYNGRVDEYNSLATEYNGKPFSAFQSTTLQNQ